MMKRIFSCFVVLVLFAVSSVRAEVFSAQRAGEIADNWIAIVTEGRQVSPPVEVRDLIYQDELVGYLVNYSCGYVVVGFNYGAPVKAWSGEGRFFGPVKEMVLKSLYRGLKRRYVSEVKSATLQSENVEGGSSDDSRDFVVKVGPLLTSKWGQEYPYNLYSPNDPDTGEESAAGCLAVAMAQIMNYWAWPEVGEGDSCYLSGNEEICDFFGYVYDWPHIVDFLDDNSSALEISQTAGLIYNIGVLAQTQYRHGDSWGFYEPLYNGMSRHMRYHLRWSMAPEGALFDAVRTDIDKGQPVFIGSTHAFVADGYLIAGNTRQIHFNFGWGGEMSGWYTPDELAEFHFLGTGESKVDLYSVFNDLHPVCSEKYPEFCETKTACFAHNAIWDGEHCGLRFQPEGEKVSSWPTESILPVVSVPARPMVFAPSIKSEPECSEITSLMYVSLGDEGYPVWGKTENFNCESKRFSVSLPISTRRHSGEMADVYIGYVINKNDGELHLKYTHYRLQIE